MLINIKNIVFVSFLSLIFFIFSCGGSSQESESLQKKEICKKLELSGTKEKSVSVQPPAFTIVSTHTKAFSPKIAFNQSHLIVGFNIKALMKLGFLDTLINQVYDSKMVINALSVFDLKPGSGLEHILIAFQIPKLSKTKKLIIPNKFQIFLRGNFNSSDVLNRIYSMASSFDNLPIPPITKEGKSFTIKKGKLKIFISSYDQNSILITSMFGKQPDFSNVSEYVTSVKNITLGTSLWFVIPRSLPKFSGLPKLAIKFISNINFVTGYINNDSLLNLETQVRLRTKTSYDAKQLKEIIKLVLSQIAGKISSNLAKSLNLSGNTDKESVVSRGPLVRVLFKIEPNQTIEVVNWIKKQLIRNRY